VTVAQRKSVGHPTKAPNELWQTDFRSQRGNSVNTAKKRLMVKPINHILVVDDEAEFVNTINQHLKRECFIMDSASDVEATRFRGGCLLIVFKNFKEEAK